MPFAEIRNDTVILKNGGLRAVMIVEPINFNLKSETEQVGIITGYESFINTLVFPVQILVRSTKVDIDPYLALIEKSTQAQTNELLKNQTISYAKFIKRVVDVADIMTKKFYVIIPLDEAEKTKSPLNRFLEWMNTDDTSAKKSLRDGKFGTHDMRLKERVDLVSTGLQAIGLIPKRLKTMELISLYYEIYNRSQRQSQKVTPQANLHTVPDIL